MLHARFGGVYVDQDRLVEKHICQTVAWARSIRERCLLNLNSLALFVLMHSYFILLWLPGLLSSQEAEL